MKERMISRGDLFYYDFGDRVGSVQSGERPVLMQKHLKHSGLKKKRLKRTKVMV